jgi:hypothetical protein
MSAIHDTANALQQEWGLSLPDHVSEEEILQLLAEKITVVIAKGPEVFFQLMYRLDIPERKLNIILHDDDAPIKIAKLVFDRQMQKAESRSRNTSKNTNEDPELKW